MRIATDLKVRAEGKPMNESIQRMIDKANQPDAEAVFHWIGPENYQRWTQILQFIETNYPGVFVPEWRFGGKKHGWSLRFKKSKSFCTLIPERNRLKVQIVLGGAERQKTEMILAELHENIRREYAEATTYHDGKWLAIILNSDGLLNDIERLLFIKRKPKQK